MRQPTPPPRVDIELTQTDDRGDLFDVYDGGEELIGCLSREESGWHVDYSTPAGRVNFVGPSLPAALRLIELLRASEPPAIAAEREKSREKSSEKSSEKST